MKSLVFLGPPGSGKGTQADLLVDTFSYVKISTGDLVRAEIQAKSELGQNIQAIVASGKLVPDDIIISLFEQKLTGIKSAFIADGFPRTVPQAKAFEERLTRLGFERPTVVYFELKLQSLLTRILSRRVCADCKKTYNIDTFPPIKEGICDVCGGQLEQRQDDTEAVVRTRFEVYQNETEALLDFYRMDLVTLDASLDVQTVTEKLKVFLK